MDHTVNIGTLYTYKNLYRTPVTVSPQEETILTHSLTRQNGRPGQSLNMAFSVFFIFFTFFTSIVSNF